MHPAFCGSPAQVPGLPTLSRTGQVAARGFDNDPRWRTVYYEAMIKGFDPKSYLADMDRSGVDVAVYDAALLIENKLDQRMDGVIVVLVPPEVQVSRLVARSGISSEEAERRVAAQLPLAEKARYATWIVDNSNDLGSTRDQVARVCQAIREGR